MDMNTDSEDQDKAQRRLTWKLAAWILITVLCLSLVLVDVVRGSRGKEALIPVDIRSSSYADYGSNVFRTPLSPVELRIIREILKDRRDYPDPMSLDLAYDQILAVLKTPVPSVTPFLTWTPTPDFSPTASNSPTASPTSTSTASATPTATATWTPSPSPTASPTPTATNRRYPTFTPTRTNTPTRTATTTRTATATQTATVTPTATATLTIDPQALLLRLAPSPLSIAEPGGTVTYALEMENTVAYSLTITSLVDNRFGDLDGQGSCQTGVSLLPGQTLGCYYQGAVMGDAGDSFSNQVTAVGQDPIDRVVTVTVGASVAILDVKPTVDMALSPDPTTIAEPEAVVTYTLTLTNTAVETLTLTSLNDDRFGDLDGQGDCQTDQEIPLEGLFSCVYSGLVQGDAGDSFENAVTATVRDNDGNAVSQTITATVTIVAPETSDLLEQGILDFWDGNACDPSPGNPGAHTDLVNANPLVAWRRTGCLLI